MLIQIDAITYVKRDYLWAAAGKFMFLFGNFYKIC